MTFEQVVLLLTLLGGAVYVTFEITWTVSHSDDKKKKWPPLSPNCGGHFSDETGKELAVVGPVPFVVQV